MWANKRGGVRPDRAVVSHDVGTDFAPGGDAGRALQVGARMQDRIGINGDVGVQVDGLRVGHRDTRDHQPLPEPALDDRAAVGQLRATVDAEHDIGVL